MKDGICKASAAVIGQKSLTGPVEWSEYSESFNFNPFDFKFWVDFWFGVIFISHFIWPTAILNVFGCFLYNLTLNLSKKTKAEVQNSN